MTRSALVSGILLTALAWPALAVDDAEIKERSVRWEGYFQPGVKAMQERDLTRAEELFWQALREIEPLGITSAATATLSNLCAVHQLQGNYKKAQQLCSSTVAASQRLRGNVHPEVAMDLFHLAEVETRLQNYDQALKWLTHAIDIMRKTGNGLKPPTKIMLEEFARNWELKGDMENAAKVRKAIAEATWQKQ
jgi:tetratricopeptide (TPR) repeat protein